MTWPYDCPVNLESTREHVPQNYEALVATIHDGQGRPSDAHLPPREGAGSGEEVRAASRDDGSVGEAVAGLVGEVAAESLRKRR